MLRSRLLELLESFRLFRKEAGVPFFFSSLLTNAFALPFMGLGVGSSLLRYGGMKDSRVEQDAMFVEVLRKGLLLNVLLMGLLWFFSESTHAVFLLVAVVVGARYYGVPGYAWAFVLAPMLTVLLWMPALGVPFASFWKRAKSSLNAELWRYGLFTSLSNVVSQLLFALCRVEQAHERGCFFGGFYPALSPAFWLAFFAFLGFLLFL